MQFLFEKSDTINQPYEAFSFDASTNYFPVRPHWHYYLELILMKTGTAMFESDGTTYILNEGDMILFYPQTIHSIYAVTGFPIIYDVIKFNLSKIHSINSYTPRFDKIFLAAKQNKNIPTVFKSSEIDKLNFKYYFSTCIEELEKRNFGYDVIIHNTLSQLLINILRIWKEKGFDENKSVTSEDSDTVGTITSYIDEHSDELLSIEQLAERCGLSYSFFAKKFHELYGRSCKEYIELIRICKAEDLLLFTDHDVNWIAQETGFADASHLIKVFKKLRGTTPKQFRLQHKSN